MNVLASPEIAADYQRWGYPEGFNYLTGTLEWASAILIAIWRTRVVGSLLGSAIMAAAAVTVILAGEYSHAMAPAIVLVLALLNAWLTVRARRPDGALPLR